MAYKRIPLSPQHIGLYRYPVICQDSVLFPSLLGLYCLKNIALLFKNWSIWFQFHSHAVSTETSCFLGSAWTTLVLFVEAAPDSLHFCPNVCFLLPALRYAADCDDRPLSDWLSVRYGAHTRALTSLFCCRCCFKVLCSYRDVSLTECQHFLDQNSFQISSPCLLFPTFVLLGQQHI